ncbi:MAG: 2-oxoglutarate ferredoxin oxidoreductase subunit alpha [Gammaproteobacteria bacterium]|jgi:2-oxoglutarate ferredoxin oxidoreductase subunit alpha
MSTVVGKVGDALGVAKPETESVVIRFAGDSGDGMQLTGGQFTEATALYGNDLATFPDFPAEIRAPTGTTFGVSAFQINFSSQTINTAGDALDVLVAMNPAALVTNLSDLTIGGVLIVDTGSFGARNLKKAGYAASPLEDGSLDGYRLLEVDVHKHVLEAVAEYDLGHKNALRCKNMWVLGLLMWIYGRERDSSIEGLQKKFASQPQIRDANIAALNAGHAYADTAELADAFPAIKVPKAEFAPGLYRNVTGAEAMAWGLVAGGHLANVKVMFASYPITPASSLLHTLAALKEFNVVTFQAEDEIAAACAAVGASYAGSLGVSSSAGPGIALKAETISLACSVELPLIVVNTQRGGPSTGLPTKTEQSDLYQAVFGRHGDTPLVVLAPATPSDCFDVAIEAARIATRYTTPVMVLSDGYLANAAEPWQIPSLSDYEAFPVTFYDEPEGFHPSLRDDETLARAWVKPGTPGLEHRVGGIEKAYDSGNISYDPDNHQRMTDVRAEKVQRVRQIIPPQEVCLGDTSGELAVVGWGSTYGAILEAVKRARKAGKSVSHVHVRYMWPLPENLGEVLAQFDKVLVPEMNKGQFLRMIRSEYLIDAVPLNKVSGQPFKIAEIEQAIHQSLEPKA